MVDILIVDDDALTRGLLESLFTTVGYTVCATDNGRDGLMLVHQHTPRVALIDLYLPDMDGLMLVGHLQRMSGIPVPHLFLMSVHVPMHLGDVGQRGIFTKPFDLDAVLDQVALVAPLPSAPQAALRERWSG